MKRSNELLPKDLRFALREFHALHQKLSGNTTPAPKDISRYRELALSYPVLMEVAGEATDSVRSRMLAQAFEGGYAARLLAEQDAIKRDTGYRSASPLEKLLIDQILTTKLHVFYAEIMFAEKSIVQMTFAESVYLQNYLASAQRRHLRAIETLARVQRCIRETPMVQINIANAGSRQMNIQGDLFHPPPKSDTASAAQPTLNP